MIMMIIFFWDSHNVRSMYVKSPTDNMTNTSRDPKYKNIQLVLVTKL